MLQLSLQLVIKQKLEKQNNPQKTKNIPEAHGSHASCFNTKYFIIKYRSVDNYY